MIPLQIIPQYHCVIKQLLVPEAGLNALLAIHKYHSPQTLGGCRFMAYSFQAAAYDAIHLAQGMVLKLFVMAYRWAAPNWLF